MRLWVLAHELAGHALFEADHLRESLSDLVRQHVGGFRPDPNAVAERLGSLDADAADPMAALQQALGDPEVLLGAVTSPAQLELRPRLDALVAVVVGYTDWIVDAVAVRVVGGSALRIAEAVRRRRVETTASDSFVEQLLGIRLGESQVARGKAFVQGVVDRAGDRGLRPAARAPRRDPDAERGRCAGPLAGPHRAVAHRPAAPPQRPAGEREVDARGALRRRPPAGARPRPGRRAGPARRLGRRPRRGRGAGPAHRHRDGTGGARRRPRRDRAPGARPPGVRRPARRAGGVVRRAVRRTGPADRPGPHARGVRPPGRRSAAPRPTRCRRARSRARRPLRRLPRRDRGATQTRVVAPLPDDVEGTYRRLLAAIDDTP